ncbi:MAG TPA: DUF4249 family protein, partial [Puia sp.]|nr:DUF4249 family protein [Puia sp.]
MWLLLALACGCWQCVETYVSPYKSPPTGYLVVEGFISGNAGTQYRLTRSFGLQSDAAIPVVTGATLQVEGTDSSHYPLSETGGGFYGGDTLPLNSAAQYRLRIVVP